MKRIIAGMLVTVGLMGAGVQVAEARVTRVEEPVKVVVAEPVPSFVARVRTNTTLDGKHYASIWVKSPVTGRLLFAGDGGSESRDLKVIGDIFTDNIKPYWGLVDGVAVDDVDGRSTALTLDVRRRSRVSMSKPVVFPSGTLLFRTSAQHYNGDGMAGKYIASKKSPVHLQEKVKGAWVTVATSTTDSNGMATLVVDASTNSDHRYRVRRPDGATVWAAASKSRLVHVG